MRGRDIYDSLFRLDGQVALVTGASSGIGLATAQVLASAGASVVLTARGSDQLDELAESLREQGLDAVGMRCDASVPDELDRTVAAVLDRFGKIDTVFCNAGTLLETGPHVTSTDEQFDGMFDLHVRSPLKLANLVLPAMAENGGGSFTIMSSLSGLRGNRVLGLYGMTKAANAQLARNLAVQWGPQGIRANAVSPGVISTPFAEIITKDPARAEARLERTPLRRFGTPEEVAGTVAWLASPAGAFVSGQNIVIDGGTLVYD